MADEERNPIDQLVDLFVYAPVGLLYEYNEVMPKLVRRGRSQVQLARFVGKMAMGRNPVDVDRSVNAVADALARGITDIGVAIGLAPPDAAAPGAIPPPPPTLPPPPAPGLPVDAGPAERTAPEPAESGDDAPALPLPIARYDELTAKEIVGLLDDLEPPQLDRIRIHEEANRARKTVLGKLSRLGA